MSEPTMPISAPKPEKKVYETPQIKVLGNLAQLTKMVGSGGNPDGGVPPMEGSQL